MRVIRELIQKGLTEQQAGRLSLAKSFYEQVLRLEPRHPDALNLLGVLALQAGDPQQAAALIGKAIEVQPGNPGLHANLAQVYLESRRAVEAHDAFRRAANLDPRNPQFTVGAAVCLALQGKNAEAEGLMRRVLQDHPGYSLGWYNLGNLLRDHGRHVEAMEIYQRAIRVDPSLADAHNELGRLLHQAHQFDEAEQAYRKRLALEPDSAPGSINLASLLIDRGKSADAIHLCREAIARLSARADTSDLHWMLGCALAQQGDLASARTAFGAAVAVAPGHVRALSAYGVALFHTGRAREGIRCIARAQELEPHLSESGHGMAGILLSLGDMPSGWRAYRQRPARAAAAEKFSHVKFAAETNPGLEGKSVLLLREQGLGDELFFLRFAPELKSRGATITYHAHAKIASMLSRVGALNRVIAGEMPRPAADLTVMVGDLPGLLGPLEASPYPAPEVSPSARPDTAAVESDFPSLPRVFYPRLPAPLKLEVLPQQLRDMKERLSGLGPPPYIGLTWRAGTAPEQQGAAWMLHKEIPVARLGAAVRSVSGTLLALQRNPRPGEIEELSASAGKPVHDLTALNEDLEAMLALLALAGEYIGVSNTNMHLRAGVGRTARVLMPCPAEWRWFPSGSESPWFPGFRIYRQGPDGSWDGALRALERDLQEQAGHG